jgi:hypothetical protein
MQRCNRRPITQSAIWFFLNGRPLGAPFAVDAALPLSTDADNQLPPHGEQVCQPIFVIAHNLASMLLLLLLLFCVSISRRCDRWPTTIVRCINRHSSTSLRASIIPLFRVTWALRSVVVVVVMVVRLTTFCNDLVGDSKLWTGFSVQAAGSVA